MLDSETNLSPGRTLLYQLRAQDLDLDPQLPVIVINTAHNIPSLLSCDCHMRGGSTTMEAKATTAEIATRTTGVDRAIIKYMATSHIYRARCGYRTSSGDVDIEQVQATIVRSPWVVWKLGRHGLCGSHSYSP